MNPDNHYHKNITVSGHVQGVGFRYAARNAADFLGLKGFVKNLPNGDVYIEAEGNSTQLNDFIAWCHQGPVRAIVKKVDIYDSQVKEFKRFEIR